MGRFDRLRIIDTDSHWSEPHDLWTSRAPAAYADRVPQLGRGVGAGVGVREPEQLLETAPNELDFLTMTRRTTSAGSSTAASGSRPPG
jgi:hypothetical protein